MSFTLIPGRNRGKHDPDTVIARLQADNVKLLNRQAAADDFFALLIQDVNETNAAWRAEAEHRRQAEKAIGQLEAVIRLRDQQIDDLTRKVDVGVKAEHVIAKTQEFDASELRHPVHTLHEAAAKNLLGPTTRVSASGASADPGHPRQTTWGRAADDTQPLAKVVA